MLIQVPLVVFGLASAAAAVVGALGSGAAWVYRRSPVGRARRRAKKGMRPLQREAGAFEDRIRRIRGNVERPARAYARAEAERKLDETGLEALREAGFKNLRLAALEDAGLSTLADLVGVREAELAKLPGVGPASAKSIVAAAAELRERLLSEPPELPRPELDQPGAKELAAGALRELDAREDAGEAPRRLVERTRELGDRLESAEPRTRFLSWLAHPFDREGKADAARRTEEVAEEAEAVVRSGLVDEAAAARKRLRKPKRTRRFAVDLAQRFAKRYAECCALIDRVFGELGLRPGRAVLAGRGGLSDEVARRVEEFPLRTAGLRASLRRYQEFGASYLLAQERTILGDEMGLGKTVQALAAMVHLAEDDPGARFAVVAPAGLLHNWAREVEHFTSLRSYLLHGPSLKPNLEEWLREGGVAITSYATLRSVGLGGVFEDRGVTIEAAFADEAHFAKNPVAGRTIELRKLLARSRYACLLSGTPMENHPDEFVNLIEGLRPEEAARLRESGLVEGDARAFHREVARVYLRRNQEDVLTELPDRIETDEWVELSSEDRRAYGAEVHAGNFMGMRQAATLGSRDEGRRGSTAKLERLAELLEEHRAAGNKVLVFSYFLKVLAEIERRHDCLGVLSGALNPAEKQALCDEFTKEEGPAVLLLQITAGGQGLNLQAASAVVLVEPQTKPTTEAQAIARAHRMGQTRKVLVHRLLSRGTCDESLVAILAEKGALFDAFARRSLVKEASGEATEASVTSAVMAAERHRMAEATVPEG